jgi:DNA-binding response OmpR family regulator
MSDVRPILLVEDSPDDRELITAALAKQNLENPVDCVSDGEQALDYLYRRGRFATRTAVDPVVVLLDLKLPKVSGHEVLAVIREDRALKSVPVVILTSSREDADIIQSYELGTNAYVVKPVRFTEFVAAVKGIGVFWTTLNELPSGSAT